MTEPPHWRALQAEDLARVETIAAKAHPALPERREVLAEKLALFSQGCFAFICGGAVQGYALSHPWKLLDAPALDEFLVALPRDADCLFLHDVALLPDARGHGAVASLMPRLHALARSHGLAAIGCISVYGTDAMWGRYGFTNCRGPELTEKLTTYGDAARYMTCAVH